MNDRDGVFVTLLVYGELSLQSRRNATAAERIWACVSPYQGPHPLRREAFETYAATVSEALDALALMVSAATEREAAP